jgi:putative addiction module killer protein
LETVEILETDEFRQWFEGPRDLTAKFRIVARIRHLSLGNLGDARAVGGGVMELRTCPAAVRGQP